MAQSGSIIRAFIIADYKYVWRSAEGAYYDEIDYSLYNKSHPSGSAYYDLTVLQTPILEAFTNNTSTMKSKLLTVARQDLLYLPVIRLNHDGNSFAG